MPNTVPNQRTVTIHREHARNDFLGIKNENWQSASRDLGAHALQLYLYFASNADNYQMAISPTAIRAAIGMARSTYHDQFTKLVEKGYLVNTHGNHYEFYETPQTVTQTPNALTRAEHDFENCTATVTPIRSAVSDNPQGSIEINNKYECIDSGINNGKIHEAFIF